MFENTSILYYFNKIYGPILSSNTRLLHKPLISPPTSKNILDWRSKKNLPIFLANFQFFAKIFGNFFFFPKTLSNDSEVKEVC